MMMMTIAMTMMKMLMMMVIVGARHKTDSRDIEGRGYTICQQAIGTRRTREISGLVVIQLASRRSAQD
eukprot:7044813-Pyramimonas_sp.AAC.1